MQPRAMSLISGMWGVGQIAGPALGGLTLTLTLTRTRTLTLIGLVAELTQP